MRYPLPYAFAKAHLVLLEDDGSSLVLWASPEVSLSTLSEVQRQYVIDRLEKEAGKTLTERISAAYAGSESSAAVVVGEVESAIDLSRMMQDLPAVEDLLEAANDAPIIRMLNALLTQAAKDGASDIHIEPYERASSVRFRVDGTLREVVQPNRGLHAALISRLKIMAELDIAEKRLPQDGRISLRIGGRAIDVRVSTLPSAHGERAVLRLLDKTESKFTLEGLGMNGELLASFQRLVLKGAARLPNGAALQAEKDVIAEQFAGDRTAYLAALRDAHATVNIARDVLADQLRRRAVETRLKVTAPTTADIANFYEAYAAERARSVHAGKSVAWLGGSSGIALGVNAPPSVFGLETGASATLSDTTITANGPAAPLAAFPLAKAQRSIRTALTNLARGVAFDAWVVSEEKKVVGSLSCSHDKLPDVAPVDLTDYLPFLSRG